MAIISPEFEVSWADRMDRLLAESPEWLVPVTYLALAGVAPEDAVRLRWRDFDGDECRLRIPDAGGVRDVRITPAFAALWRQFAREPDAFVVVAESGASPVDPGVARRCLAETARRAGAHGLAGIRFAFGTRDAQACAG